MKKQSGWGVALGSTLLGALAAAGGCSTSMNEGTNTNWLCDSDDDCADAGDAATCVAHECVVATGSGGRSTSGGAPGSGGKTGGGAGGLPNPGGQGGGLTGTGGTPGDSGSCVRAARSEPCQSGRYDCDVDFRKEKYKFPSCQTFDNAHVRSCGAYDGLTFPGDDSADTLFFAKSDGHLAGIGRAGLIEPAPACEWYDEGFTVPACPFPDACVASRRTASARPYYPDRDCYGPKADLAEVFVREAEPATTSGLHELVCMKGSDGTRYAVWLGITEGLEFAPQSFEGPPKWRAFGDSGLFVERIALDPACQAVVSRGLFDTGAGLGTGELITADAGDRAVECP
jgi:hypothetical protein